MDEGLGCIVLIICLILLFFALKYWYVTVPLMAIITALYFSNKAKKKREAEFAIWQAEQDRLRAAEEARLQRYRTEEEARLQRYRTEQEGYLKEMVSLSKQSIDLFESMPQYLNNAERNLDQAEKDFNEGAFAPFWDSIETSANMLGRFNEGVRRINEHSSRYTELLGLFAGTHPRFPVALRSVSKLQVGTGTAQRMAVIVRNAQRNFQFATIYEQRKTNQILVSGFTNLAQALVQMTSRITSSIEELSNSVGFMTSTIEESARISHSRQEAILEATIQSREEFSEQATEQAQREERALEMLDNIQRGRRPSF
jgi:hypothetical protein